MQVEYADICRWKLFADSFSQQTKAKLDYFYKLQVSLKQYLKKKKKIIA